MKRIYIYIVVFVFTFALAVGKLSAALETTHLISMPILLFRTWMCV